MLVVVTTFAVSWRATARALQLRPTCAFAPCQVNRLKWTGPISITSRWAKRADP